jgi:hypothetical protein
MRIDKKKIIYLHARNKIIRILCKALIMKQIDKKVRGVSSYFFSLLWEKMGKDRKKQRKVGKNKR